MIERIFSPYFFLTLVARIIVLMTALPVHEFAHAFAANKMGDPTAKDAGRLTLNPLAHLDPQGALLILLMGFGFAKPVPVDPRNFKNRKAGELITALAGPLANVLMAFITLCITKLVFYYYAIYAPPTVARALEGPIHVFDAMVYINCGLAVFNLLPCPPLDGFHVFAQFLPERSRHWVIVNQGYFSMALVLLVFTGLIDFPLAIARDMLADGLFAASGFIELMLGL